MNNCYSHSNVFFQKRDWCVFFPFILHLFVVLLNLCKTVVFIIFCSRFLRNNRQFVLWLDITSPEVLMRTKQRPKQERRSASFPPWNYFNNILIERFISTAINGRCNISVKCSYSLLFMNHESGRGFGLSKIDFKVIHLFSS